MAILDRPGTEGAAVAEAIGGYFFECDITDFEGTEQTVAAAIEALGGLDVGVNVAGGGIGKKTLDKHGVAHDLESFRQVVDLNLVATFNLNRLQAEAMAKNEPNADDERGVIINTASIAAFEGQIGQIAYTASKAGVAGMCLTMARDLGSFGIRVNAIAPSLFDTGLVKMAPDEMKAKLVADAAFPKRMGQPDEYATARRGDHRQPDAERRHHPPRRRSALRAALIRSSIQRAVRRYRMSIDRHEERVGIRRHERFVLVPGPATVNGRKRGDRCGIIGLHRTHAACYVFTVND